MEEEKPLEWPEVKHKNRIAHLIMCNSSTCGNKEKGSSIVPIKQFKRIVKEEGMKSSIKITESSCLGVCKPHNVMCLLTEQDQIWLGLFREQDTYDQLLDWLRQTHKNKKALPLPKELEKHRFNRFSFE
ncbi:MAG: hypothetical protein ACXAD7_04195 [Candidatus Kariarchaeaceae archaeon]